MKKLIAILLTSFCILALSPQIVGAQSADKSVREESVNLVSVKGRVFTPRGKALRSATVVLTDAEQNRRTVTTNRLGAFTFYKVPADQTYVIGVAGTPYRFTSRVINVTSKLSGLVFRGVD
ncbi:carboxypeptidase regulatory-like domain-containing protein [bacterium]|nr:MAG: carboxypeptidase regulatory-like domain-containing protein [bacterium]